MAFCNPNDLKPDLICYSNKLNSLFNKFCENQTTFKEISSKSSDKRNNLKELHTGFAKNFNDIVSDITFIIERISNDQKEQEHEESPASKITKRPHYFEQKESNSYNEYVVIEEDKRLIRNIKEGWCTVKIRGSLEDGVSDTLEVRVLDIGNGSHGSGLMFGVVEDKDINVGRYPGEEFFSFARHGLLYDVKRKAVSGGVSSKSCGNWGVNDVLKLFLDPTTGHFTLDVNDENRLDIQLNINSKVCFCVGLYYLGQRIEIL